MSIEYNETKFIFGNELANCYLKTKSDEEKARLEHKIKQKKKTSGLWSTTTAGRGTAVVTIKSMRETLLSYDLSVILKE